MDALHKILHKITAQNDPTFLCEKFSEKHDLAEFEVISPKLEKVHFRKISMS